MRNKKNLHIVFPEKFFNKYIQFINNNFKAEDHLFLYLRKDGTENNFDNVKKMRFYKIPFLNFFELFLYMSRYDRIFLHSLSKTKVVFCLFFFPFICKKAYWLLWGGDMYYRLSDDTIRAKKNLSNFIFKRVVGRLGFILTHINGDVSIAREQFGFKGKHLPCLLYPSNVFNQSHSTKKLGNKTINILLGNSSHASNNHHEILEKLRRYKDLDIKVYCPLSYGDKRYAKSIIELGHQFFGDKFIPITEFLSLSDYYALLNRIDIAIFNHWRQQAVGNIITLIGMGKTVYLRKEVTTVEMLMELGIEIQPINLNNFELIQLTQEQIKQNISIVKSRFSEKRLFKEYQAIFNN